MEFVNVHQRCTFNFPPIYNRLLGECTAKCTFTNNVQYIPLICYIHYCSPTGECTPLMYIQQ